MVKQCQICRKVDNLNPDVSFHRFPRDENLKKSWLSFLGFPKDKVLPKFSYICSRHFKEDDFITKPHKYLKPTAAPGSAAPVSAAPVSATPVVLGSEKTIPVGPSRKYGGSSAGQIKYGTLTDTSNNKEFSFEFLNGLSKPYLFRKFCDKYISFHNTGQLSDDFLEDFISESKESQRSALDSYKTNTQENKLLGLKRRSNLYVEVEKNKKYAPTKTGSFGRCRLCLYCFEKSDLYLFSTKLSSENDVTIKDCLSSLLPSLDTFQPNHAVCITCYNHLFITLHFFKITLNTESILSTVLRDQPFIFNEEKEDNITASSPFCADLVENIDVEAPTVNNTSDSVPNYMEENSEESIFERNVKSEDIQDAAINQSCNQNERITKLEQQQMVVLNKFLPTLVPIKSTLHNVKLEKDTALNRREEENKINNLTLQQSVVLNNFLPTLVPIKAEDGSDVSYCYNLELNQNAVGPNNSSDKPDIKHINLNSCGYQETTNSNRITSHFNLENCPNSDSNSLNNYFNLDAANTPIIDGLKSENDNSEFDSRSHDHPYVLNKTLKLNFAPAFNEVVRTAAIGSTLLNELGDDENLEKLPHYFIITKAVSNPEDLAADCAPNMKIVSLDFNVAKEKRIIFLGHIYCEICQGPKSRCNCGRKARLRKGGMCEKCGKYYARERQLKIHIDKGECLKCLKCEKCNTVFTAPSHYKRHLENIADAPVCNYFQCKLCSAKFTKADFREHIKEHPNHLCPKCAKSFVTSGDLHKHIGCSHKPELRKQDTVVCEICGKLIRKCNLSSHMISHTSSGKETCHICEKQYTAKRGLLRHIRYVHNKAKTCACSICGKKFSEPASLKSHIRVVHMKKPVETCKICNVEFARRDYYRKHMLSHHSVEVQVAVGGNARKRAVKRVPVICNICKLVFINSRRLQRHYRDAHGAIRYKCRLCHMTFSNGANKWRHEKLHRNPYYEFGCRICHLQHKSAKELQLHMKKTHNKKPKSVYQCYQCNEVFCSKYLLRDHIRQKHPAKNIEEIETALDKLIAWRTARKKKLPKRLEKTTDNINIVESQRKQGLENKEKE